MLAYRHYFPPDSKLVQVCEEAIKLRLKAPAGYQRVRVVSWNEPGKIFKGFEYDSPNDYGTLIRGADICEFDTKDGDESRAGTFNVRIGGKTQIEWYLSLKNGT